MQVVIDISQRLKDLCDYSATIEFTPFDIFEITKLIRHGTVLSENHGRFIDADKLKENAYSVSAFTQVVDVSDIDNAPTVLERTK